MESVLTESIAFVGLLPPEAVVADEEKVPGLIELLVDSSEVKVLDELVIVVGTQAAPAS